MTEGRPRIDDKRAASRARFARLVAHPEPEIDLALGALIIAGLARPGLDERAAVARLDGLAEHVRFRVDAGDPERVVADRLHDVLYREAGYRAPTAAEYGDPANSHLDAV